MLPRAQVDGRPADLVVVGAGAAGLWAAEVAARAGARVLLLEKTPRTGTKILASGGTRCNLTTTLEAGDAAALFGKAGERFLLPAFWNLPPQAVRERFHAWGVPTETAPLEKVFPASHNAKDVRDALERAARAAGAQIRLSAPLVGLERSADGFGLHLADGSGLWAPRVVLAVGGQSYPKTGTTGDGYAWLRALRLPLVEPVPALVPLRSPAAWVRDLTGIALPEVEVRLCGPGGQTYERRRRPLLFTHQGLSGPGAMDLSARVARAASEGPLEGWSLAVDFLPEQSREALRERCIEAAGQSGNPRLDQLFGLDLPRRVEALLAERCGLSGLPFRVGSLDRSRRHALVETLKGWPLPVDGTLDYDKAEVTAGGLALKALDPGTLRVHGIPGLYVIGELLDLQGPIGGLNFQAAFATAELAGLDAARRPA
jgi:hypothetical protein